MKQKKLIRIIKQTIEDENGNLVELNEDNMQRLANKAGAIVKSLETGEKWEVKGA